MKQRHKESLKNLENIQANMKIGKFWLTDALKNIQVKCPFGYFRDYSAEVMIWPFDYFMCIWVYGKITKHSSSSAQGLRGLE